MKTTRALIPLIAATFAFAVCSCSSRVKSEDAKQASTRSMSPPQGWNLVSQNPATYFPEGIPKDKRPGLRDGTWVIAGEGDARWFIPKTGTKQRTAQELAQEAFSMRTKAQKFQIRAKQTETFLEKSAATGVLLSAGLIAAMGQADIGAFDRIGTIWTDM